MSAAIDINSEPVRAGYLDPDERDPQLVQEAREQAITDYVDDWVRGNLADQDDVYSGPLGALMESHGDLLGQLVRHKHNEESLLATAQVLASALEEYIRGQA